MGSGKTTYYVVKLQLLSFCELFYEKRLKCERKNDVVSNRYGIFFLVSNDDIFKIWVSLKAKYGSVSLQNMGQFDKLYKKDTEEMLR